MAEKSKVYRTELSPLNFLQRSARVFNNRTAVIYNQKRFTYGEFYNRVYRLAAALRGAGVEHGDRVAFLVPNIPPLLEAHFGVPLSGAVLVAINIRLSGPEISYILNHAEAKVLVVDTEFASLVETVQDQLETVKLIVKVEDLPGSPVSLDGPDYESFLAGVDINSFYQAAALHTGQVDFAQALANPQTNLIPPPGLQFTGCPLSGG